MLDEYFKNYFWTFHLVAIFVAALLVARTVNAFVGKSLQDPPEKIAAAAMTQQRVAKPKEESQVPLTAFLERNLFDAEREDLVPVEVETEPEDAGGEIDPNNCDPSGLGANLLATVVSSDPASSVAMFQDTAQNITVQMRIGDKLLDTAEVHAIEWRRVLVRNGGKCEEFTLEDPNKTVRTTPSPAVSAAPPTSNDDDEGLGKGVKKMSDSEYEIPREEIDNVLSNLNKVATQARIVPSFHNGKANGFKLFSIRPNSLYSKIGIQNGDIVQKINGYEMNSPDKALEIYSKLKDASTITVDLVRRGKSQTLSYSIR